MKKLNNPDHMSKIVELPPKGKALVITDLHGNLRYFRFYERIWKEYLRNGHQVVLAGDLIHGLDPDQDYSIEMLDAVIKYQEYENFHYLLGNHELSHITEDNVYKCGFNQRTAFEDILYDKFLETPGEKLREYIDFFEKLPLAVKTSNQVIISHAGPPQDFTDLHELDQVAYDDYLRKEKLKGLLWRRGTEFTRRQLELFLEYNDAKFHVVGHTPVDGYQVNHGRQLVISSGLSEGRRTYLELDLEKEVNDMDQLVGMLKFVRSGHKSLNPDNL